MSRRFSLRALMIVIAVVALGLGSFEMQVRRKAQAAAARARKVAELQAKYAALANFHRQQEAFWQNRAKDYDTVFAHVHGAIHLWKEIAKVQDAADLHPAEVVPWTHPDPTDCFRIIRGPSAGWDRRLQAHRAIAAQCRARALYHMERKGYCFHAGWSAVDGPVAFAKELADPPPLVDPYPPEFRSEFDAMPIPRKPAAEPIARDPDSIYRNALPAGRSGASPGR